MKFQKLENEIKDLKNQIKELKEKIKSSSSSSSSSAIEKLKNSSECSATQARNYCVYPTDRDATDAASIPVDDLSRSTHPNSNTNLSSSSSSSSSPSSSKIEQVESKGVITLGDQFDKAQEWNSTSYINQTDLDCYICAALNHYNYDGKLISDKFLKACVANTGTQRRPSYKISKEKIEKCVDQNTSEEVRGSLMETDKFMILTKVINEQLKVTSKTSEKIYYEECIKNNVLESLSKANLKSVVLLFVPIDREQSTDQNSHFICLRRDVKDLNVWYMLDSLIAATSCINKITVNESENFNIQDFTPSSNYFNEQVIAFASVLYTS